MTDGPAYGMIQKNKQTDKLIQEIEIDQIAHITDAKTGKKIFLPNNANLLTFNEMLMRNVSLDGEPAKLLITLRSINN